MKRTDRLSHITALPRKLGQVAALCGFVLLQAGASHAHDFWIEPSSFHPLPGAVVSVGLRVGQDFIGDPVRRQSSFIKRFVVLQGGGEEAISGSDAIDPAGLFEANGLQTAVIVYQGSGAFIELPAGRFDDYLKQNGLDEIVAERARRGEGERAGRERFYRNAKAILAGRRGSDLVTKPVGLRYEIVPFEDPTLGMAILHLRVLFNGKPLAGAQVEAIAKNMPVAKIVTQSDDKGDVRIPLSRAGLWLIRSVHMRRAGWFSDADWESDWASLTFEMP